MICGLKLILVALFAGAFVILAPATVHAHAGHKHEAIHQIASPPGERHAPALDQPPQVQATFASSSSAKMAAATQLPCGGSCCSNQSCCSAAIALHPDGLALPARYRAEPPMLSPSPNTPAILAGPSEPPRPFA